MNSYRRIIYHLVFVTNKRKRSIEELHCRDLYRYIHGIIKKRNSIAYAINGVADHIHILSDLHPTISLANFVKEIKVASSIWMKESGRFPTFDGWQAGYGAFTYSYKDKSTLTRYVRNQKTHHQKEALKPEYKRILEDQGVRYDERHLF